MRWFARYFMVAAFGLALMACNATQYRSFDAPDHGAIPLARVVQFYVADDFFRAPPDCAVVLRAPDSTSPFLAQVVEHAATRRLRENLPRVVGPYARMRVERDMALDLREGRDQKRFARLRRCHYGLEFHRVTLDETYAMVWSERRLSVEIELRRLHDGASLWRVAHQARDGDGGVPLSPIGLGNAALRAGLSHSDAEALPSLADDAMRRLFATFPDMHR